MSEHLKAPVAEEPVDLIGAHAPPDCIALLQDLHAQAAALQTPGALQPSQPGSEHHNIGIHDPPFAQPRLFAEAGGENWGRSSPPIGT